MTAPEVGHVGKQRTRYEPTGKPRRGNKGGWKGARSGAQPSRLRRGMQPNEGRGDQSSSDPCFPAWPGPTATFLNCPDSDTLTW